MTTAAHMEDATMSPTESPVLIVVGGLAGVGKSTIGRRIARTAPAVYLDKDTLCTGFTEALLIAHGRPADDRDSDTYRTIVRPLEYQQLMNAAFDALGCGTNVVVVAPFVAELATEAWHDQTAAAVGKLGGTLLVVWVTAAPKSMRTYLARRGEARDAHKLAHWNQYLHEAPTTAPPIPHIHLDNSAVDPSGAPPNDLYDTVAALLGREDGTIR